MGLKILPDKNKITRVINIANTMIVTKNQGTILTHLIISYTKIMTASAINWITTVTIDIEVTSTINPSLLHRTMLALYYVSAYYIGK